MSNDVLAPTTIRQNSKNLVNIGTLRSTGASVFESTVNGRVKVIAAAAAADRTLTADESGSIIVLPAATANNTITLPAHSSGLNYKFVLGAVPNGTNTWVISATDADTMSGTAYGVIAAPVGVSATLSDIITINATAANARVGDWLEVFSDGSIWYYTAWSNGTAALFTASG
jgi:hypothetical protein